MADVLTLVSPDPLLDDAVRELCSRAGLDSSNYDRLHARAVDVSCDRDDVDLGDASVDFAIQAADGRRKRLLVADMESTIIRNEMLDELAEFVGCREQVAEITERAMNGELDFHQALAERVALLEGLSGGAIDQVRSRIEIDPGARMLVATMNAHGARTALVSSGFDVFAEPIAAQLGFDDWQANVLEVTDGALSGKPVPPILDKNAKLEALRRFCKEDGIEPQDACTVGDGANDLLMLQGAGLGVAYHGKPRVAEAAPYRVDHNDLTALLFFQGYREDEIE